MRSQDLSCLISHQHGPVSNVTSVWGHAGTFQVLFREPSGAGLKKKEELCKIQKDLLGQTQVH